MFDFGNFVSVSQIKWMKQTWTLISFFTIMCQWKLQSLKETKGNDIHRNPSLFKRPKLMLHLWRDYYYYFCSRMRDWTNWYPLIALPGAVEISKILVGKSLCGGHNLFPPKLCNQVSSLSLSRWEEYCESLQSWLLSQVWNIKTHNLYIFSTETIPRILSHKMVQGGDLIS